MVNALSGNRHFKVYFDSTCVGLYSEQTRMAEWVFTARQHSLLCRALY